MMDKLGLVNVFYEHFLILSAIPFFEKEENVLDPSRVTSLSDVEAPKFQCIRPVNSPSLNPSSESAALHETLTGQSVDSSKTVPIDHLDFSYIEKCSNVKELEKIYRVLKSGKEGKYVELEHVCEEKIRELCPTSRALRKETPLLRPTDIDKSEWEEINTGLDEWLTKTKAKDLHQKPIVPPVPTNGELAGDDSLPPVRSYKTLKHNPSANQTPAASCMKKKDKRVTPRDASEWAKLEKELETNESDEEENSKKNGEAEAEKSKKKVDFGGTNGRPSTCQPIPKIDKKLKINNADRERLSMVEKDKGNEAFRADDLEEALAYYSRSISILPSVAAYNNRGLIYNRQKKWDDAIKDFSRALSEEPENVKALLRRATALQEVNRLTQAKQDIEAVLKINPTDPTGLKMLESMQKALKARDASKLDGGRRMVIDEVGSSSDDEDDFVDAPTEPPHKTPDPTVTTLPPTIEPVESPTSSKSDDSIWSKDEVKENASTKEKKSPITTSKVSTNKKFPGSSNPIQPIISENKSEPINTVHPPNGTSHPPKSKPIPPPVVIKKPVTTEEKFLAIKEEANSFFRQGYYVKALPLYDKCVDLCPENVIGYRNRAVCHLKLNMPNDALYDCNMALDIDDSCSTSLYRRGLARKMLGDYEKSSRDLIGALQLKPDNIKIQEDLQEVKSMMYSNKSHDRLIEEITNEDEVVVPATPPPASCMSTGDPWDNSDSTTTIRDTEIFPEERKQRDKLKQKTNNGPTEEMFEENTDSGPTSAGPRNPDSGPTLVNQTLVDEKPTSSAETGVAKKKKKRNKKKKGGNKRPSSASGGEVDSGPESEVTVEGSSKSVDQAGGDVASSKAATPDTTSSGGKPEVEGRPGVNFDSGNVTKVKGKNHKIKKTSQDTARKSSDENMSAYDFNSQWSSLRPNFLPEKVAALLLLAKCDRLHILIGNNLDETILGPIAKSLKEYFVKHDRTNDIYEVLKSLSLVSRITMVTMLAKETTKTDLKTTFNALLQKLSSSSGSEFEFTETNVKDLRKAFAI